MRRACNDKSLNSVKKTSMDRNTTLNAEIYFLVNQFPAMNTMKLILWRSYISQIVSSRRGPTERSPRPIQKR
jgi:hypothetical protein